MFLSPLQSLESFHPIIPHQFFEMLPPDKPLYRAIFFIYACQIRSDLKNSSEMKQIFTWN
ncbi:MAG: hypothetical protein JWN73_4355 [Betaproteobacteria bacterium]|nr:hypothetical protein [Betaproteobacteria bacterium]